MVDDLNFFINKKPIAVLYEEQKKTKEDLAEDRRLARELLEKVIARLTQLGVSQLAKKRVAGFQPKGITKKSLVEQFSEGHGCDPCI